ncbi:hypothetical protein GCM10023238_31670 [Streptomyces heliomycini]
MGDGILFSIKDPERPKVIDRVQDNVNFAFWHSGPSTRRRTRSSSPTSWAAVAAATCNAETARTAARTASTTSSARRPQKLSSAATQDPRHQADTENCVAHNGSLIDPGQGQGPDGPGWYQGGVSVWDFTTPQAEGDRLLRARPLSTEQAPHRGSWSAYYYNGYIYSNDIAKASTS